VSLRWFQLLYGALWHLGLPLAIVYLWWRARRDPRYAVRLGERFGRYRERLERSVWVHAVSLGEVRSAVPVIAALLARGERVVVTHFTPAGRAETERAFGGAIAAGRLAAVWVPVETSWAYGRFFRSFRPRAGLVMEVEHWPRMILSARAAGIPLFPCNAQYPARSYAADRGRRRWRLQAVGCYAGAMAKSDRHAERFRAAGLSLVAVTGETRFDMPVPQGLVAAGAAARAALAGPRPVVALASTVEGEDAIYLSLVMMLRDEAEVAGTAPPLIVWVPRQPARFDAVADRIAAEGLRLARRSAALDDRFGPRPGVAAPDVLLGDSLGEMFGYLAMADRVVVGGGFTPRGAHNIIEALALDRPVVTGPVTWPIEYPFEEARAAGLARSADNAAGVAAALSAPVPPAAAFAAFRAAHGGAAVRTLAALDRFTSR
jgi:3-deoxy-D-manno-octulosonic-acid transferase